MIEPPGAAQISPPLGRHGCEVLSRATGNRLSVLIEPRSFSTSGRVASTGQATTFGSHAITRTCEPMEGPAVVTIDLDAVAANYRRIQEVISPASLAAVVKANAYGLGAKEVAASLAKQGCTHFFVAFLSEAGPVIEASGPDAKVFVLNGLAIGEETFCDELCAIPVLNSCDQVRRWNDLGRSLNRRLDAAIQIDSGMARLGLSICEIDELTASADKLSHIEPILIMSHLASADDPLSGDNERQRLRFEAAAAFFPAVARSLSNSGGSFLGGPYHYEMVRSGIALYGVDPQPGLAAAMQPAVSLKAQIVQVRSVPAGQGIGYSLTSAADRDRRIATVPVGYADGWPRRLGNRGFAFVGQHRVPIVGRISMDSLLIDVTDVPGEQVRAGALVELLGAHQSLCDVASDADTIAYEILTQIGPRYARRYLHSLTAIGGAQ